MYPSDVQSAQAHVLSRRCVLCEHTEIAHPARKRAINFKQFWRQISSILWF